jgi:hypothetical protein
MKLQLTLALILLFCGCQLNMCPNCDDQNPCTHSECVDGKCVHKPMHGPMENCYGSAGCIEYGCFHGECIAQKIVNCCGNGVCDPGESYETCPRDCAPSCSDGIRNQGEKGVDCGGPCPPCASEDIDDIIALAGMREAYAHQVAEYGWAIREFNRDKNTTALRDNAIHSLSEAESLKARLENAAFENAPESLRALYEDSLGIYIQALNLMALYAQTGGDSKRIESNRLFAESIELDSQFVQEYNTLVDEYNLIRLKCSNHIWDPGEESVDCGGICQTPCQSIVNITKYVTVRVEGGPAQLKLNISSPAIDMKPMQEIIETRITPPPDGTVKTGEGNMHYLYGLRMPAYGIWEAKITKTVRLYRTGPEDKIADDYFSPNYYIGNELSPLTAEICERAGLFRQPDYSTIEVVGTSHEWMIKNIDYEINHGDLGAQYCFRERRGACDEQADLFISFSRCNGIGARRVTGSLINESTASGHAWAQYYDSGWYHIDPSIKDERQAYNAGLRHIGACVGDGAYHCGVSYTYTYLGKKPDITVSEQIILT